MEGRKVDSPVWRIGGRRQFPARSRKRRRHEKKKTKNVSNISSSHCNKLQHRHTMFVNISRAVTSTGRLQPQLEGFTCPAGSETRSLSSCQTSAPSPPRTPSLKPHFSVCRHSLLEMFFWQNFDRLLLSLLHRRTHSGVRWSTRRAGMEGLQNNCRAGFVEHGCGNVL